ncbi:ATP-binding protein [Periweissella cryptocerci]|uniref:ATP-binding protein n=1 Tax=Periweissella cryptocerci TaxID=2506420 RepID=A0A4P6YTN6_9LACO|nr:ATP-binding protein [Periweissella cryptocerci]QBO36129.1 ATP-binding protein [Periweissella cryptocerci]
MIARERYMKVVKPLIGNEFIKIITGVRRSGKSVLLEQIREVIKTEYDNPNVIYLNFESFTNRKYLNNPDLFYGFLAENSAKNEKTYYFFDEIQLVQEWEAIINSLRVDFDADIYVTGSNASILSGEMATLLSGRYVQIEVYPFSFKEYVELKKIEIHDQTAINQAFADYMYLGGMPSVVGQTAPDDSKLQELSSIYDSILLRDISLRIPKGNQEILDTLALLLMDSITSEVNLNKIKNRLKDVGFNINSETLKNYMAKMDQAYLFYTVEHANIRGSERLRANSKYYTVDNGLWHSQIESQGTNLGNQLENLVFIELKRRGYKVKFGEINGKEIDFVASKNGNKEYYQVTYEIPRDSNREIENLLEIPDNYLKTLIVGVDNGTRSVEGVNVLPIKEWLLSE